MEDDEEEKTDNEIERMRNIYNFDCCILLVLLILILFLVKMAYEKTVYDN